MLSSCLSARPRALPESSYEKIERLFKSIITNMRGQVKRFLNEFSYFWVVGELFSVFDQNNSEKGLGIVGMFCYTPFVREKENDKLYMGRGY